MAARDGRSELCDVNNELLDIRSLYGITPNIGRLNGVQKLLLAKEQRLQS